MDSHIKPLPDKDSEQSHENMARKSDNQDKSDTKPQEAKGRELAPENDIAKPRQKGRRGYLEKVPPPHYREKIQKRRSLRDDPENPDEERDQRWYAGYQVKTDLEINPWTYGLYTRLSRFRPSIEDKDMTLIQIFVGYYEPNQPFQTLEAGWQRIDHSEPSLFIFFTTNDYGPRAPGVCGYVTNEDSMGYVFLDNDPVKSFRPGKTFLPSTHIGSEKQLVCTLQWHLVKGTPGVADGWYLSVNERWNGYFPLRFFERGVPDKKRSLADHANLVDIYGEVKDDGYNRSLPDPPDDPQKRTTTDMGSGRWPLEGFGRAAHFENIQRLVSPPTSAEHWEHASDRTWNSYLQMNKPGVDPKMYGGLFFPESGTSFGSHVYLGGPGFPVASGKWDEWEEISTTRAESGPHFDPLACVCLLKRVPNWTYAFMVGKDELVWGSWQTVEGDWSGFNSADEWAKLYFGNDSTPKFDPKAKLTIVARTPQNLDIFAVAKDGKTYTASWTEGQSWKSWKDISGRNDRRFPSGAPITAVSRFDKQLDVFVNAGWDIFTTWWTAADDPSATPAEWAEWVPMNAGIFSANIADSAELLVLSRQPGALTVAATGQNGHVYVSSWLENLGWSGFGDVGTSEPDVSVDPPQATRFAAGGKVAGVVSSPDQLDLFAVSSNLSLYTCSWTSSDGWSGVGADKYWTSLGYGTDDANKKIFDPATSDVVAVKRDITGDVDVFVTGNAGQVYRTHRSAAFMSWTSGLGAIGWDEGVGSERRVNHERGFRIGAVSRNPSSLSVVSITKEGTAVATAYEGLMGIQ